MKYEYQVRYKGTKVEGLSTTRVELVGIARTVRGWSKDHPLLTGRAPLRSTQRHTSQQSLEAE